MVGVGKSKTDSLARCSIVNYYGRVLYDEYIRPKGKVTDYRYKWSGILPHHLKNATPFRVARKKIFSIIKDKVIVGHALNFDFKVLKIRRQSDRIRDTSTSLLLRDKAGLGNFQTPSLKLLTKAVLGRDIQGDTHCSIEDSVAAMELYRTVETKWEDSGTTGTVSYFDDLYWPEWVEKT